MLSGAIGGLVAILLVLWLSRREAFKGAEGELGYRGVFKGIAWSIAFLPVLLLYVLLFVEHNGALPLLLLIAGFGVGAGYMLAEAYVTKGRFDENGIEFETPWMVRKKQKWSDLTDARFDELMQWHILTFRDGTKIRLSSLLSGHGRVLEHVRSLDKASEFDD